MNWKLCEKITWFQNGISSEKLLSLGNFRQANFSVTNMLFRSIPPFKFRDTIWRLQLEHMCVANTIHDTQKRQLRMIFVFTKDLVSSFSLAHSRIQHSKYKVFSLLFGVVFFPLHVSRMQMCAFFIASKCHFITVLFRLSLMFVCLNNQSYYYGVKWKLSFWFVILVNFIRIIYCASSVLTKNSNWKSMNGVTIGSMHDSTGI